MEKPVIVITPQNMPMEQPYEGNYNYSNTFNTDAVLRAGGIPVIPPYLNETDAEELLNRADGLLMSGGADVSPAVYGQKKQAFCGITQPLRDQSDLCLLKAALSLHKPVVCICRGSQIVNAYLGGSLYQDLKSQFDGGIQHVVRSNPEYKREVHTVKVLEGTPLYDLLGKPVLGVNSLHHQAVCTLAPGLKPMAYASDGLVESWYLDDPEQWIRAYQWHPEMLEDRGQCSAIFEEFITVCRAGQIHL